MGLDWRTNAPSIDPERLDLGVDVAELLESITKSLTSRQNANDLEEVKAVTDEIDTEALSAELANDLHGMWFFYWSSYSGT